jgi:hypothetical protein
MLQAKNEYQVRDLAKYEESAKRLRAIVDELNQLDLGDVTEFEMLPPDENYDHIPRSIYIKALIMEGELQIMCDRDGYGNTDRWEFTAIGWPKYTNENGDSKTIDPSDLWNPKANRPTTTAAQDRPAKAIAKQIAGKIIGDYIEVFKRCLEKAQSWQEASDTTADAISRLAAACQDEREFRGRPQRTFYIRNVADQYSKRVEFRSVGDVQITLTADEAIAVIELLRKRNSDS